MKEEINVIQKLVGTLEPKVIKEVEKSMKYLGKLTEGDRQSIGLIEKAKKMVDDHYNGEERHMKNESNTYEGTKGTPHENIATAIAYLETDSLDDLKHLRREICGEDGSGDEARANFKSESLESFLSHTDRRVDDLRVEFNDEIERIRRALYSFKE